MDFDFFSNQPFDPERLKRSIPYLNHAKIVQLDINTLTCRVDRGGEILMSFFGDLDLACVQQRIAQNTPAIYIAALLDLAGTKAAVVQKRAEEKDYIDINALLQQGIDLPTQLAAASIVYKDQFNPLITLKALSYFGDVPGLSIEVKERLEKAVAQVDINRLPALSLPKTTLP